MQDERRGTRPGVEIRHSPSCIRPTFFDSLLVLTRLAVFVCTFGYIGYFPVAPGTVGSVAGLVVFALLRWLHAPAALDATLILVFFAAGVWSGTHAERYFGTTDPGPGVIDEVVGMLITLFLLPGTSPVVLAGFFIFRVLDVIKPYPAGRFESFHGGMGMMADDVMSAIYANALLRLAVWIAPGWLL
jgi:phosphatidylglycerophosphatase A